MVGKFLITSDTLVTRLTACALSVTCGASSPKGRAKSTAEKLLITSNALVANVTAWLPPSGELARERLRGFIPRKKAAAPGTAQQLVYNIKVSQFFFAA